MPWAESMASSDMGCWRRNSLFSLNVCFTMARWRLGGKDVQRYGPDEDGHSLWLPR